MKFELDSQHLLDSLEAIITVRKSSMTSLNIIGKVMNLPMSALECIWRKSGEQDVDPSSLCIDEKSLELFAEAYIRKMKNYFERSAKDIEVLSSEERNNLIEFYNHFKIKEEYTLTSKSSWGSIDISKLHDAFLNEVWVKTEEHRFDSFSEIRGLSQKIIKELCGSSVYTREINNQVATTGNLLYRISHSKRYLSPQTNIKGRNKKQHCIENHRLRKILKSARFFIFVADKDSDSDIIDNHCELVNIIFKHEILSLCKRQISMSLSIISGRAIFQQTIRLKRLSN